LIEVFQRHLSGAVRLALLTGANYCLQKSADVSFAFTAVAERDFAIASKSAILSFIISFGVMKALANLIAGTFSDRVGRKKLLVQVGSSDFRFHS